jgi:hypothetical protein
MPAASARRADRPAQSDLTDVEVVRDAQSQALDQAEEAQGQQQDPRTAALWEDAIRQMEKALECLRSATNSPEAFQQALAAEQAAYQALLKAQEREYSVRRSRNRQSGQSSRQGQMQSQLDQLDLPQTRNRYETERQARSPQTPERREQLQVMNRLQELARRQQDLNERLQELQTALQEARTEQQREEVRRQLKRLEEEEQQMLADADDLRQRMDRNQSSMTEQRRQLEQAREDLQRATEAARQGQTSQALASGTRAQRQLQQMRDQLRQQSSGEFDQELRQMRAEARELARREQEIQNAVDQLNDRQRRTLSDADISQKVQEELAQQGQRLTNLVDNASQLSLQAEEAEPLMSRELYDTVRKFSQDDLSTLKRFQEDLVNRGLASRNLYERLKRTGEQSSAKALDLTSEMLQQGYLQEAGEAEQRARAGINELKRGVERAAESVLGDDAESLRLARDELERLGDQLQREIAQAEGGQTNRPGELAQANDTASGQTPPAESARQADRAGSQTQPPQNDRGEASARQAHRPQDEQRAEQGQQASGGEQPGGQAQQSDTDNQRGRVRSPSGPRARASGGSQVDLDRLLDSRTGQWSGPITGEDFAPWSDGLRNVEELVDTPTLRNDVARARERARQMRQDYRRNQKKPDWAAVRLQILKPLVEVRAQLDEELARREPSENLVPIDRDPVPGRYSELVRRYYELLGQGGAARKQD